jgi:chemotaxis protein MotB
MIRKLILAAAVVLLLGACGTRKKLAAANDQIQQLQTTNQQLTGKIDALTKQVSGLSNDNASVTNQLNACQKNVQMVTQKYQTTQAVLKEEADDLDKVQRKLDEGLADFESKGVEVYNKHGMVYVSMQDNLLYKSGSAALSDSAKKALAQLAGVLNDYPKLRVIVVGNTDTIQFKKGSDNWALSTERANGVVRVLRDSGVDPSRLTAAGKGKYDPVADNSTAEGRARNRRTEIVLNPDLDRIWMSVQGEQ